MLPLRSVGRSNFVMVCVNKFNNVDSKATYYENCCVMKRNQQLSIMKKSIKNTINNMSSIKVHTKGRQRDEFKI